MYNLSVSPGILLALVRGHLHDDRCGDVTFCVADPSSAPTYFISKMKGVNITYFLMLQKPTWIKFWKYIYFNCKPLTTRYSFLWTLFASQCWEVWKCFESFADSHKCRLHLEFWILLYGRVSLKSKMKCFHRTRPTKQCKILCLGERKYLVCREKEEPSWF